MTSEICRQVVAGDIRGVPSLNVIRITAEGELSAEGPISADCATLARAAQLLESLLDPSRDAGPEFRAPGPMRLALLRARGHVDLPAYAGLAEFRVTLARFAHPDVQLAIRDVYSRWRSVVPASDEVVAHPPATVLPAEIQRVPDSALTVSDVRRARRATGLTLGEVAERARIPAGLLRELEWGYLWNWPAGLYGRTQLVRYARAAGLDERVVVDVVWPLLEAAVDARGGEAVAALPAEESADVLLRVEAPAADLHALAAPPVIVHARVNRFRGFGLAAAAAAAITLPFIPAALRSRLPPSAPVTTITQSTAAQSTPSTAQPMREPRREPLSPTATRRAPRTATVRDMVTAETPAPDPGVRAIPASAIYAPGFSNIGTAMFFHEDGAESLPDRDATVLKITRILDDEGQNFHAHPSPDGSSIAFDSDRDGERAVYVADADGKNVRKISGDGFAAIPSWSPDGQRLAFVKAASDQPRVWNLWVAEPDGGALQQVTFNASGQPWGGSWFPDGRRLAFSQDDALVVLDLNADARRTYRSPVPGRAVRMPAVSPDGRRIIFQVSRDGAWLLDLTKGGMRRVLDDPSAEEYTWAPDGHRVAFHSRRIGGWGVWVMGQ